MRTTIGSLPDQVALIADCPEQATSRPPLNDRPSAFKPVPAPLFPRYLFVSFDRQVQRWRSIQSTIGVSQLVCNGEDPASISEGIIAELRGREDERGFVRLERRSRFARGDQIRVVDGVFDACLGLFEDMVDHERVAILLDLLGRKVRVVLHGDAVAAA